MNKQRRQKIIKNSKKAKYFYYRKSNKTHRKVCFSISTHLIFISLLLIKYLHFKPPFYYLSHKLAESHLLHKMYIFNHQTLCTKGALTLRKGTV